MPQIKIRFITDKDFMGEAIRFVEHAPITAPSHVEFELEDGTFLGAHSDGGVQIRPANYCRTTWDRRYAIEVTQAQYDCCMAFAHAQIGKPYDFSDIVGIALNTGWHTADKWICSELVLASLLHAGVGALNVLECVSNRIDPDRLHLSPLLIGGVYYESINDVQLYKR